MSDFDPDRIYKLLTDAGEDWVDKQAAAELLEETKKSVLAEVMGGEDGSMAAREAAALASTAYRQHLRDMVDARREANRARVKYDSMKVLAEMRRSQESTRRAEIGMR